MTSRQRLQAVLSHQPADRLCVDLGAGFQTGICVGPLHQLHQHLLGPDPDYRVRVHEPYQMLGAVEEALSQALRLDVIGVHGPGTMFGFRTDKDWKEGTSMQGIPLLLPEEFVVSDDGSGGWLVHHGGDPSAPPRGHMPAGGFYFDTIPTENEVDDEYLDPRDNCEEFAPISEADADFMAARAARAAADTDYGIYMTLPGLGFGDIALVPAPMLAHPKGIRDLEEWYVSTLTRPDYVRKVFDYQLECALETIDRLAERAAENVDVVFTSGTDFGAQHGPFLSVGTYRDLFKPYHLEINRRIHEKTRWKTFLHTDGSVRDLIPEFIEAGFDVLNPVQWNCTGMDPKELKSEFGKDLVFWGGAINSQGPFANGSPDEVYREAREMIEVFFSDGTGFVFNGMHNIQHGVPVENILAMFKAADDVR